MSGHDDGCCRGCGNHSPQPHLSGSNSCSAGPGSAGGPSRETRTSRYRRRDGVKRPGTRKLEEILLTVHRYRLVDREIVQLLHFTPKGRSAAQRALTNLWWSRHLDKLPGRALNDRDVYLLSGKASRGMKLLAGLVGPDEARSRLSRPPSIDHTLAVNNVRARVEVSARLHGFEVEDWQDELDLARLEPHHVVPDGFFVLSREVEGRRLRSGFFFEVELAPVSRSHWRQRLEAYAKFYYSHRYEEVFGLPSLRLLVVVPGVGRQQRSILEEAQAEGFTPARVTTAEELRRDGVDLLESPIWCSPNAEDAASLF